jgi:hypothetical protein
VTVGSLRIILWKNHDTLKNDVDNECVEWSGNDKERAGVVNLVLRRANCDYTETLHASCLVFTFT